MNLKRKITTCILWIILVTSLLSAFSTITSLAAPTNQPLVFGNPSPANGTTGNWWSPPPYGEWIPWNIPISDPEGNRISWTIQCSNGQTTSGTNAFNGSKYLAISTLSYSTTYKIWVNATDPAGSGLWTRNWYTFTTRGSGNNPPVLTRAPSPANGSSENPLSLSWGIRINDLDGDLFSWSLQCSNGQETSGTSASNGTKSLTLSGLVLTTSYKVWVNATDPDGSGLTIHKWFTFTTKANDPPVFGAPSLTNNSIGNSLDFTWRIPISDPDGNSFNWWIQCSSGQSANANGASNGTKSLPLTGLDSSTTYTVWVNATDPTGSGLWTRQWYTFTTQGNGGNTQPEFGAPSPANSSTENRLYFNWNIPINDPEGTDFSWTIHCNNGQTTSGSSATNGTKSLFLSGLAYSTSYKVWVNATDPTGRNQYTRKWYEFTTEDIFPFDIPTPHSWAFVTSESGETRVGPLVADINKDGRTEIIRSGINGIVVYDGLTGSVVWKNITPMWDSHNPLEIVDLNKDGYLDVISSYDTGTRALSGEDGSQLWYNANAPLYNKHAVAGDINADGYPEVFVTAAGAEDGSPQGWITSLTHTGQIISKVHVYFPCYGGLSLGDTDFDGVYELFLSERNIGYDGNVVGKGVAAFWASNLTQRWSHPEMLSSSHCPTLVDTNKDGILEVVALAQTGSNGVAVYNSSDGTVIHQSNIPGVRCHSQPTVYDIDGDGNLEIIVGGGSDAWGKPAIWDLYTWSLETFLPFNCWEPPAIADINGDGRVEIIECTITNISIFDDNYVFRGSIPLDNNRSGSGWYGMSMIVAQDIDNDNKLELVLNRNTRTYVYDTDGAAPTPRATSQYMYYSPLRGRYPYSTPTGTTAPWAINEYPANESINIPFNPQLSVYIYDNQKDSMDITIRTNASTGIWHAIATYPDTYDGTYTADTTDMDTPQSYYWWNITATDSTGKTTYKLYHFKTISGGPQQPPFTPSNPFPINESTDVPVTADLSWTGGDPNGDPVTYDVYFGTTDTPPKVVSNQSLNLYNPSTMSNTTHYYWKIIAWDNHSTSTEGPLWEFTTGIKVNNPPNLPSNPSPANGATKVVTSAKLSWTGGDPDSDPVTYDVYFGTTSQPPKVKSNQTTLTYTPGTLAYDTTYYWNIVARDNHGANVSGTTFDPWNFTTKSPGGGGGGGGGGGTSEPDNIIPIADVSAGEPYQGNVNSQILFDGSKSHDSDGNITKWTWTFGDNTNGTGKTVRHTYTKPGTYTVNLIVTDDGDKTDTDTTTCVITQPNRLPTKPIISGPTNGTKNTTYNYTVKSTDPDNDTVQYSFNWGDPLSPPQSSGFLPNGSVFTTTHSWASAGRYSVTVTANDDKNTSSSETTVYINAKPITDLGYLIDNDSNGIYDAFYSDTSKKVTPVQEKNGNYSIDADGNGVWDYTFDVTTGQTSSFQVQGKTPGFEFVVVIGAIALLMILKRKKKRENK